MIVQECNERASVNRPYVPNALTCHFVAVETTLRFLEESFIGFIGHTFLNMLFPYPPLKSLSLSLHKHLYNFAQQ